MDEDTKNNEIGVRCREDSEDTTKIEAGKVNRRSRARSRRRSIVIRYRLSVRKSKTPT